MKFLKKLFGILLVACCANASAQPIHYGIDTALHETNDCKDMGRFYFQLKAKYPDGSRRLANRANLACKDLELGGDGNITFRMIIDCDGKIAALRLLQTDAAYQKTEFAKEVVARLYRFVKDLREWKKMAENGEPIYYFTYLNFKIRAGHVAEVTP